MEIEYFELCDASCPGWGHFESDYGPEIQACQDCNLFPRDGCEYGVDDDKAQAAHDKVCACSLNTRTRTKLSSRPTPAPWIIFQVKPKKRGGFKLIALRE